MVQQLHRVDRLRSPAVRETVTSSSSSRRWDGQCLLSAILVSARYRCQHGAAVSLQGRDRRTPRRPHPSPCSTVDGRHGTAGADDRRSDAHRPGAQPRRVPTPHRSVPALRVYLSHPTPAGPTGSPVRPVPHPANSQSSHRSVPHLIS